MSIEGWVAKKLFGLPEKAIVRIAGGKPYTVGGRTLDPHLQLAMWSARNKQKLWEKDPARAQRSTQHLFEMLGQPVESGVQVIDVDIPSPEGHLIPARYYHCDASDPAMPLLVFFHMGGGVVGDLNTCHSFCSILAKRSRGPVLSIDYRLAPQHRFPAGLNDARDAYRWAWDNKAMFQADTVAVGGDSMGGNFAAVIAQEFRSSSRYAPTLELLIYPPVNMTEQRSSHQTYKNTFMLSMEMVHWFLSHYLEPDTDRSDPRLSPELTPSLADIAPSLVFTAGHDPLVDEGDAYAKKLADAGVPVFHQRFDSMVHGFTGFPAVSPGARRACEAMADHYRSFAVEHALA